MSARSSLIHACACLACLAAPAATTLTVHNRTGQTLAVTRLWSPWRPEPDDPPMSIPYFQRLLGPGEVGTYHFQLPGKDLESSIIIRHLPEDGVVSFENMTITAAEPAMMPLGEDLPPEPEAPGLPPPGIRSSL
jgi:hypothetical protein